MAKSRLCVGYSVGVCLTASVNFCGGRRARCQATAGLSLGEYTALVAGGALTFHDALMVVKVRAEAMQKAADHCKGTMMTVVGLGETELAAACKQAASTSQCLVQISNYLFPKGLVVGGEPDAIAALKTSLSAKEGLIVSCGVTSRALSCPGVCFRL